MDERRTQTLRLDETLKRDLRDRAYVERRSENAIIAEAVREYLDRTESEESR